MSTAPRFALSALALAAFVTVALPREAAAAPSRPAGLSAVLESGLRLFARLLPGTARTLAPGSGTTFCSVVDGQQICIETTLRLDVKGNRGCAIDPLGLTDC